MTVAVDFDGTLCEKRWPELGQPNKKLINHLIMMRKRGHKVILNTNREHYDFIDRKGNKRDLLQEALDFCQDNGLIFDAVNENLPELIAIFGHDSRKISANIYIDDQCANEKFCSEFMIPYDSNSILLHEGAL